MRQNYRYDTDLCDRSPVVVPQDFRNVCFRFAHTLQMFPKPPLADLSMALLLAFYGPDGVL